MSSFPTPIFAYVLPAGARVVEVDYISVEVCPLLYYYGGEGGSEL